MGFSDRFKARILLEMVSADMPGLLAAIADIGVLLESVDPVDALTVRCCVHPSSLKKLESIAERRGATFHVLQKKGIRWPLLRLITRPVFVFGLILMIALELYLPTRVLFVCVEGNNEIPVNAILEQAAACGIRFGASRREVRSERMKNNLLASIPQLQWAGINTQGCTAVISVRERSDIQKVEENYRVSRIVAVRDGIIDSCTVTKGNALCVPGQAVMQGQVLISGYTDCGLSILATRAEGEIFAKTIHEITAVSPLKYQEKGQPTGSHKKISLLIGKKRINLYKDSGISGITCDKMYLEYYVMLPGGFCLPFALVIEEETDYLAASVLTSADSTELLLRECTQTYLQRAMVSGTILSEDTAMEVGEDLLILNGRYLCTEMIGREQNEEILQYYGKNN